MNPSFGDFYRGRTVLVTGDTGFKGSWLATWLTHLGADVVGYALTPPTDPSNFVASRLDKRVNQVYGDIRDYDLLAKTFREHRPELVFHLAAQPLVQLSYAQCRYTFDVNLMGTVNALEASRESGSVKAVVSITSDKCYNNVNWDWGYRENDPLGGHDPYSASKACAEFAIAVYQDTRFQEASPQAGDIAVASTRAGNVIGGGDWAQDRIVPDVVRAITKNADIVVRNPAATRPWQHVLEPLSGYLWLGSLLAKNPDYRTSWNMGPGDARVQTVGEVVTGILRKWSAKTKMVVEQDQSNREARLLRLDCSKANQHLDWRATWNTDQALDAIVTWYKRFYDWPEEDMYSFTVQQIEEYTKDARGQEIAWACSRSAG